MSTLDSLPLAPSLTPSLSVGLEGWVEPPQAGRMPVCVALLAWSLSRLLWDTTAAASSVGSTRGNEGHTEIASPLRQVLSAGIPEQEDLDLKETPEGLPPSTLRIMTA